MDLVGAAMRGGLTPAVKKLPLGRRSVSGCRDQPRYRDRSLTVAARYRRIAFPSRARQQADSVSTEDGELSGESRLDPAGMSACATSTLECMAYALKRRKAIPFEFVLDALSALEPVTRPMFGCLAIYAGRKIVLILRDKGGQGPDNGVWLATTIEHHESLSLIHI